ncbi:MAG: HEAT repeat domain-containing protein [Candidatus Latescibacteria bacterium]|nr:HEAT repeat domain-containing protein [Candidatus Latescibacterota bacterium]
MHQTSGGVRTSVLFVMVLAGVAAGCSNASKRIDESMDRIAWTEQGSPVWEAATEKLIDLDRAAARTLTSAMGEAWYRAEDFRAYQKEMERIRCGAAFVLGTLKYKAAVAALAAHIVNTQPNTVRKKMAWALGEIGTAADVLTVHVDAIAKQLEEEDPLVALEMAIALCKMDDDRGDALLAAALSSDSPEISQRVGNGMLEAGVRAVPFLIGVRSREDRVLRERIDGIFGRMRDDLLDALKDKKRAVRREAARALGDIGDTKAVEFLATVLKEDEDGFVRLWAATSLSKMNDGRGISYLFEALGSNDTISRIKAIGALAEVGDAVEGELIEALRNENPLIRGGAAQILGAGGMKKAAPALIAALTDREPEVRWNAAIALGKMDAADAVESLKPVLEDRDDTVAYYAEWALSELEAGLRDQGSGTRDQGPG